MKKAIWTLLFISGCVTPDDRVCIDYDSITFEREKCIPFYGQMICANEEQTRVFCTRWEVIHEEQNKTR